MWGRVGAGVLAWVGGLAVVATVAHPESCPAATADEAEAAVAAAVGWLAGNQHPDGAFLYRWDRDDDRDLGGYNIVRHAGTMMALEQAAAAGIEPEAAEAAAAAGLRWARSRLTHFDDGRVAFGAETGASALLVAALSVHRRATGDEANDLLLQGLGRFLAGTVTPTGAVVATWDLLADEPVAGSRSPFFTGETLWALARLRGDFPDGPWAEPARRVSTYTVTERDDAERRLPPVSDHWFSYGITEIADWPVTLSADELAYARRQAGLFSLQTRYESQRRTSGPVRYTRGPTALGAGLGTLAEGMSNLVRLDGEQPIPDFDRATAAERARCAAGMLVDRQVHSDDVHTDGAWFRLGVTQVDDQQHAISALLDALPLLEDDR